MLLKRVLGSFFFGFGILAILIVLLSIPLSTQAANDHKIDLDQFQVHPPIHIKHNATTSPTGLTPTQIKAAYHLPSTGGSGTIAIVDAYDDPTAQSDLNTFSAKFGLPTCTPTTPSGCLEKYQITNKANSGWALEESLDVQWAHAIAPTAHILLVEARSTSGTDLLNAVNYARTRSDVVAVSMSWGGNEFNGESSYDSYFTSPSHATFFASSGDSGAGVQWPAVSTNVIGVGGTTLSLDANNNVLSETAWSGSGGGLSSYETEPSYQATYGIPQAFGKRAVPDVSYNADPNSGVPVYDSTNYYGQKGWYQVGGTSAGAPQWAAIKSLGTNVNSASLYQDAAVIPTYQTDFRDVTNGQNGSCGFYCNTASNYDYVTGLGSPLVVSF